MTKSKRSPIPEEDIAKLLLWCARHCCFCGKRCTTNIEIHHIDGNARNHDLDNLIPVCFDCHGQLAHYNPQHPRGRKFKGLEIKNDETKYMSCTLSHTCVGSPSILASTYLAPKKKGHWAILHAVTSLSTDIPVRLRLKLTPFHEERDVTPEFIDGLYSGRDLWNLNPTQQVWGHFRLPIDLNGVPFIYRVEIRWSIVDIHEREHKMLPFSYVWNDPSSDWWFDPKVLT